jgi:hypothetical protein
LKKIIYFSFSATKVSFTLHRSSDEFFLMKDESDTQEYQCIVLSCHLYVKVAKMSDAIYKEFYNRFLSSKESLKYQFRRMNVKEFHIPNGGKEFNTSELFPDSEVPSKLFFVLVFTNSKTGKVTKNPYHFWRKFKLQKELDTIENMQGSIESQYIRENLQEQVAKMRNELVDDLRNELRLQFQGLQLMLNPNQQSSSSTAQSPLETASTGKYLFVFYQLYKKELRNSRN